MTNPEKCAKCPVQLNAERELQKINLEHNVSVEQLMSDFAERVAAREHLVAQHMPDDSEYVGDTLDGIAGDIRAEIARDMEDAENEMDEMRREMGRYATNCDGTAEMSVTLSDGRKLVATVCASREERESGAFEPTDVKRYEPYI